MTQLFRRSRTKILSAICCLTVFLLAGCQTDNPKAADAKPAVIPNEQSSDYLRVGDPVLINFSGVDVPPTVKHEERIKADGNINLPYIGAIQAAGKTRAELQESILAAYVPKYYTHLTVNVGSEARWFYVNGQVKSPGRYSYAGEMTVTKCVAAAGDFTDFAKKTRVEVTRANGKKEVVNCNDAQRHPEKDLAIFPDDRIFVPRRLW